MKFWVITDTHMGHALMTELDVCSRPKGFEDTILKGLSEIPAEDVLIHLGDICFGNEVRWHAILTGAIKAKKWLILGNHDKSSIPWYMAHGWDFAANLVTIHRFGEIITFSHVPQPESLGYTVNIHGHFHNNDHRKHEPELVAIKNGKQVLLALEWLQYRPVTLDWIIEKFKKHDKLAPLELRLQ